MNMTGVFLLDRLFFTVFVLIAVICFGFAALVNRKYKGDHPRIKFYLMSTLILVCAMLDALLSQIASKNNRNTPLHKPRDRYEQYGTYTGDTR